MDNITRSVEVLNRGGIILFPTDTAYGIGCRMDMPESVEKLFALRKRPRTQAMPVLVSSPDMALAYWANPPEIVRHLMKTYWPGGLTIIASCNTDAIYSPIRGGSETIGLRMPDHPIALEIIRRIGVGLLGPSANFHAKETPYAQSELDPELVKLADYVVPDSEVVAGALGRQKQGLTPSTVIDCSVNPPVILRQGAVVVSI